MAQARLLPGVSVGVVTNNAPVGPGGEPLPPVIGLYPPTGAANVTAGAMVVGTGPQATDVFLLFSTQGIQLAAGFSQTVPAPDWMDVRGYSEAWLVVEANNLYTTAANVGTAKLRLVSSAWGGDPLTAGGERNPARNVMTLENSVMNITVGNAANNLDLAQPPIPINIALPFLFYQLVIAPLNPAAVMDIGSWTVALILRRKA